MFANLNQGSLIHVLSLTDGIKYNVGTIENISFSNTNAFQLGIQNMNALLTLKVNLNGKSTTIEGIPSNSNVSKNNNFIVTDNKDAMISQVEGLLQVSKDIVDNIGKYKDNIKQCNEVLKQLNPQFAKESNRDEAIADLYNKVGGLDDKLDDILTALKQTNKNR